MTDLLRRAPKIIYTVSIIFFLWSVGNAFWEMNLTYKYSSDYDPAVAFAKSKALFQASIDSVFLVTSGVMIDVLIRILDKLTAKSDGGIE